MSEGRGLVDPRLLLGAASLALSGSWTRLAPRRRGLSEGQLLREAVQLLDGQSVNRPKLIGQYGAAGEQQWAEASLVRWNRDLCLLSGAFGERFSIVRF